MVDYGVWMKSILIHSFFSSCCRHRRRFCCSFFCSLSTRMLSNFVVSIVWYQIGDTIAVISFFFLKVSRRNNCNVFTLLILSLNFGIWIVSGVWICAFFVWVARKKMVSAYALIWWFVRSRTIITTKKMTLDQKKNERARKRKTPVHPWIHQVHHTSDS